MSSCLHFVCRDAKDAVHSRDGYDYDGYKLRVEFPKGRERSERGGGGGGGGGRRKDRDRERRGPPTRRTNHRIKVTGKDIEKQCFSSSYSN